MNKKPHQKSNISGNQKYRKLFKKEIPPAKGGKKVNFFFFLFSYDSSEAKMNLKQVV